MSDLLPDVYLARHGETAWTINRRHTGLTDLPLTERGVRNARSLGERLRGAQFAHVFSSPLQGAYYTCELAGFKDVAVVDPDLMEWDYGDYEGLRLRKSSKSARLEHFRRRLPRRRKPGRRHRPAPTV